MARGNRSGHRACGSRASFSRRRSVLSPFGRSTSCSVAQIFAWVERWLARRRTREILGDCLFSLHRQLSVYRPADGALRSQRAARSAAHFFELLLPLARLLPPSLAARSIAGSSNGEYAFAFGSFAFLFAYALVTLWLLNLRLRAQYLGENLSEAVAPRPHPRESRKCAGMEFAVCPGPVAAMFEKEMHDLSRSGPMLFALVMPVVVLLIFRLTPENPHSADGLLGRASDLAFPVGAAYAVLIFTNLVFNNFGAEAARGADLFVSPVSFREIFMAKNLAHAHFDCRIGFGVGGVSADLPPAGSADRPRHVRRRIFRDAGEFDRWKLALRLHAEKN